MTEVEQLKDLILQNQKLVDKQAKLLKLMTNDDFKDVILDGFCKDDLAEYLEVSVNTRIPEAARDNARGLATAGAYLRNWFDVVQQQATMAQSDIEKAKETIVDIESGN